MTSSLEMESLVKYYQNIEGTCLHPKQKNTEIDTSAWHYAMSRLPQRVTETFVFYVTLSMPDFLSHPAVTSSVIAVARSRNVFQVIQGKCIVMLRDMETDLFDFLSILCIHMVEAKKLFHRINSPSIVYDLHQNSDRNNAKVNEVLKQTSLTEEEINGLNNIWKQDLGSNLLKILCHREDFRIVIDR